MSMQTINSAERETLRFGYGDTVLGTIVVAESSAVWSPSSSAMIVRSCCAT